MASYVTLPINRVSEYSSWVNHCSLIPSSQVSICQSSWPSGPDISPSRLRFIETISFRMLFITRRGPHDGKKIGIKLDPMNIFAWCKSDLLRAVCDIHFRV